MPARNRLKGKTVTFTIEGTEYNLDVDQVLLTHEEADDDFVSFADGDASYEWLLTVRAAQSTDADALHTFIRTNTNTEADFVFGPHGNAVPSVAQPHVSGTIEISGKQPDIGGEKGSTWTFEHEFKVVGSLTWISAAGA